MCGGLWNNGRVQFFSTSFLVEKTIRTFSRRRSFIFIRGKFFKFDSKWIENESRNGGKLWERNYFQCGESFFREEEGRGGTHAHTCGYTKKFLIIEHDHVDTTRATRFPWQRAFCARGFLRGLITRRNFITNTEGGGGEEGEVDQAACSFRSNTFHTTWDTRGGEAKWRSRRLISLGKRGIWESGWLVNLSKNSHQLLPTLFSERVEIETETLPLLSLFFLSFYISSSIEYLLRGKRKGNSITTRVFVFVAIEETQIDGQLGWRGYQSMND